MSGKVEEDKRPSNLPCSRCGRERRIVDMSRCNACGRLICPSCMKWVYGRPFCTTCQIRDEQIPDSNLEWAASVIERAYDKDSPCMDKITKVIEPYLKDWYGPSWNEFCNEMKRAWPDQELEWNESPVELLSKLIDERDELAETVMKLLKENTMPGKTCDVCGRDDLQTKEEMAKRLESK